MRQSGVCLKLDTLKALPISRIAALVGANAAFFRFIQVAIWPVLDWGIRIWLAQSYLMSGLLKVTHWQSALDLAANEYPISWMNPVTAAYTGASIELIAPLLFIVGLLTRYAALSLLSLTLVVQVEYRSFDSQLFCVMLFGWYAISGAGPISLDRLLRHGLGDSALPLAARVVHATAWIRANLYPWYLLLLRIWMFAALMRVMAPPVTSEWLPLSVAYPFGSAGAVLCGCLLLLGLATRYTAAVMLVLSALVGMVGLQSTNSAYLLMVLGLLVVKGAGWISLDAIFNRWMQGRTQSVGRARGIERCTRPNVVIVGAGFGGLSCAEYLRDAPVSVTLVDRANYHLFQPLLYQVATAGITPSDIAVPVRSLFRDSPNITVLRGTVTGVDTRARKVMVGERALIYDYLVVATGAAHSYFGNDQWAPFAPGLKRVEDATAIRSRLLNAFERAEAAEDAAERESLLTFLIVGGGPTGVELAGAISELARYGMEREFRHFDPADAKVILVQSEPRILPSFDTRLSAIAHKSLAKLGVSVLLDSRVELIDAAGVMVGGKRIAASTVLWAAGVQASPAAAWLNCPADSAGRVPVEADLSVAGLAGVYAIGDTALCKGWNGNAVPGLAPAAKQGGRYVARSIAARVRGAAIPGPFKYRHLGSLATIGRQSAVADFGFTRLWGAPAWWLWGCIHIGFLVGVRNRLSTMVNWFWSYLTIGTGIKLITDTEALPPNELVKKAG